jgi:serine phosphatase RsbU (regulator of sigma subunit)/methanogenic corrinoid protein MtbC1
MTANDLDGSSPHVNLEQYIDHLLAGDDDACLAEGRRLAGDLQGLRRLYVDVIQPSQYRIGELWEAGRISVATEHRATAINSYVASACYAPLARAAAGGPRALIACAPDELHELGARMLADLLECDGWDVDFYGTSMPVRDLVGAVREARPLFVGLSAAMVMHLGSVKGTIAATRKALGVQTPPIVVGGNAFRGDGGLWRQVGADLFAADAAAAVELLRPLKIGERAAVLVPETAVAPSAGADGRAGTAAAAPDRSSGAAAAAGAARRRTGPDDAAGSGRQVDAPSAPSGAQACARFSRDGTLRQANARFLEITQAREDEASLIELVIEAQRDEVGRLLGDGGPPGEARYLHFAAADEAPITLLVTWTREGEDLVLRGEPPVADLEAAQATLARLNARLTELARENAKKSAELEEALRSATELTRLSTALNAINGLIHSTLRPDEVMQRVLAQVAAAVGADSVLVALKHGDAWSAAYGYPEAPGDNHADVPIAEAPFVLAAVDQRRPVAIADCATDPLCIPEWHARLGVRSLLCVPLVARGEVTGVVLFNHHAAIARFAPQALDFAAQLAAAVSSALESARLFAEQQRIAVTLQENLINPLPAVAGLDLGRVSRTAFEPELVGGDFGDVFVLDDGRVAVLIGDVAGKGLRAAGLTETVRSMVRAFAAIDAAPGFVLRKTNDLLVRDDSHGQHVTAFFCVVDAAAGDVAFASAGHPMPVHAGPRGCRFLAVPPGPPLGAFATDDYATSRATLTPGESLVLYTDGVTEARRDTELFAEDRLLEACAALRGLAAQELAAGVLAAVVDYAGRLQDDLYVVTLRLV